MLATLASCARYCRRSSNGVAPFDLPEAGLPASHADHQASAASRAQCSHEPLIGENLPGMACHGTDSFDATLHDKALVELPQVSHMSTIPDFLDLNRVSTISCLSLEVVPSHIPSAIACAKFAGAWELFASSDVWFVPPVEIREFVITDTSWLSSDGVYHDLGLQDDTLEVTLCDATLNRVDGDILQSTCDTGTVLLYERFWIPPFEGLLQQIQGTWKMTAGGAPNTHRNLQITGARWEKQSRGRRRRGFLKLHRHDGVILLQRCAVSMGPQGTLKRDTPAGAEYFAREL